MKTRRNIEWFSVFDLLLVIGIVGTFLLGAAPGIIRAEIQRNVLNTGDLLTTLRDTQESIKKRCGGYSIDFSPVLERTIDSFTQHNHLFMIKPAQDRLHSTHCPDMKGFLTSSYAITAIPERWNIKSWQENTFFLANPFGVFSSKALIPPLMTAEPPAPAIRISQPPHAHGVTTSVKISEK